MGDQDRGRVKVIVEGGASVCWSQVEETFQAMRTNG